MERKSDSYLTLLRRANSHLEGFFVRCTAATGMRTEEEAAALLGIERTLYSMGTLLHGSLPQSHDSATQRELAAYRVNLVRLRCELAARRDCGAGLRIRLFSSEKRPAGLRTWSVASPAIQ